MIFHGYEVDPEYILAGSDLPDWHSAGLGEFIVGRKDGKRWFIKRNNEYRFPTAKEQPDKELRDFYLIPAKQYQADRELLRKLMVEKGKLTAEKDHIVPEVEHFISEGRIVLVSRFVENIARDADFVGMDAAHFIPFCADVARLIARLHECGIIHCDLKVGQPDDVMSGNVVAAVEGGKLIPYLIDFDLSFPAPPAKNPESIPHSDNYESPEIIPYIDGDEEKCTEITTATDVFTLGIVFHKLWTGSFPAVEVERASAGRCVANDKAVTIHKKFDVRIGEKCGATFMSLINWMLAKDPAARPTAKQVREVLTDQLAVPDKYHKGSDVKQFTELWDAHKLAAERLPSDQMQAKGVASFKRINDGGRLKYLVSTADGKEASLSLEEIIAAGYAARRPANVSEPWEEHNIVMASPEDIAAKGYVEVTAATAGGHRYRIVTATGVVFTHGYEWLISEGLAVRKAVEAIEGDEPWPGDGKYASPEFLAERGVKKILRVKYGPENRYRVEFKDREPLDYVNAGTMRKLRYLV